MGEGEESEREGGNGRVRGREGMREEEENERACVCGGGQELGKRWHALWRVRHAPVVVFAAGASAGASRKEDETA